MGGKRTETPVLRRQGEPEPAVPDGWVLIRRIGANSETLTTGKQIWKAPTLKRPNANERAMIKASLRAVPAEACGALLVRDGMVRSVEFENQARTNLMQFRIPDVDVIRLHRLSMAEPGAVMAIWHSHPFGHPVPSAQDCAAHPSIAPVMAIVMPRQFEVRYYAREEQVEAARALALGA